MNLGLRHGVCAFFPEIPAFLTLSWRNDRGTQWVTVKMTPCESISAAKSTGYEDANDAERLGLDPAMRTVVGGRAKDTQGASTSEMDRFKTETLSTMENRKYLLP
jgi:hypothetical protein